MHKWAERRKISSNTSIIFMLFLKRSFVFMFFHTSPLLTFISEHISCYFFLPPLIVTTSHWNENFFFSILFFSSQTSHSIFNFKCVRKYFLALSILVKIFTQFFADLWNFNIREKKNWRFVCSIFSFLMAIRDCEEEEN